MQSLIDLLLKDKALWLTVPRFAVVVLPVVLAGIFVSVGYGIFAVLPLALSALGVGRLVWFKLLPHETARLTSAQLALAAARPDEAVRILQLPLRFAGGALQAAARCIFVESPCARGAVYRGSWHPEYD